MTGRRLLRSVRSGTGPEPPSVLFHQLSAEYPGLSRRIVGDVLRRVYGAAWEAAPPFSVGVGQLETAARALLDAIQVRLAEATPVRTGQPLASLAPDAHQLAETIEAWAGVLGFPRTADALCQAAADHFGIAGVAVSVPGGLMSVEAAGTAGALAPPLEELQAVLGEGPSRDGLKYGAAVLVEDLTDPQHRARWPRYAKVATEQGALAQYVLPMQIGAARFGVFVLYLDRVGGLWPAELAEARVFGEVALGWLIDEAARGNDDADDEPSPLRPFFDDRPELHQATGMVSAQLGVNLATALLSLRARAFADDRLLSDLAADVVARSIRFRPGERGSRAGSG
jgi:hypothetical protein